MLLILDGRGTILLRNVLLLHNFMWGYVGENKQ